MSAVTELPFGWDDGEFISPFVATSHEDSEALAEYIWERLCDAPMTDAPSTVPEGHAPQARLSLVDLGCGEGSALMHTHSQLVRRATTTRSALSGGELSIHITGIDLDDTLIAQAQTQSALVPSHTAPLCEDGTSVRTTLRFEGGDIRQFNMEDFFPLAAPTSDRAVHVLFVYLLPDALEQLREALKTIVETQRWVLVSNRWPVPFLAEHLVETLSHLHVYQCRV